MGTSQGVNTKETELKNFYVISITSQNWIKSKSKSIEIFEDFSDFLGFFEVHFEYVLWFDWRANFSKIHTIFCNKTCDKK